MQGTVGGGRSGVQRKEEGKHQPASHQEEDTAFSLGYPSCIRPALSRPLSVNLSVGPKNFTPFLPTLSVVRSQTYKQIDATHGGPCQESGNIVVTSTIPPLPFRWAGSYFSFPRSQSASCPVSPFSLTHLPSSALRPNEPFLFAGVFWGLSIAFWEMSWPLEGPCWPFLPLHTPCCVFTLQHLGRGHLCLICPLFLEALPLLSSGRSPVHTH